jgi:hypothetical protein
MACARWSSASRPKRAPQPPEGRDLADGGKAVFSFRRRPQKQVTSTLIFDEVFCHSAGPQSGGRTYEIRKGTTEIKFDFIDFPKFVDTYLYGNPYLPAELKCSLGNDSGVFCSQVVQDGLYLCTENVDAKGCIVFNAQTLRPLDQRAKLSEFTKGAIAFGISLGTGNFAVLWATMYRAV